MKTGIFQLQVVPLKDILPHEKFDDNRALPLADKLKADGLLANPIIVARLEHGKFVQLDGMNRLSAFRMMKIPGILAQIIDYQDLENVELGSWVHLFSGKIENMRDHLKKVDGLIVKEGKMDQVRNRYIQSEGLDRLCTLVDKHKNVITVAYNGNLLEKIIRLNDIVAFYANRIERGVLPANAAREDIGFMFKEHPSCDIMSVFPTFARHQIIKVVRQGSLFPAGITRHLIKRRCLNANLPLVFFSHGSIEYQNRELEKMLKNRNFRLYEEPTIYFE